MVLSKNPKSCGQNSLFFSYLSFKSLVMAQIKSGEVKNVPNLMEIGQKDL